MNYLQPTVLSSSKRPELKPNESLLIQQGHVGLYEGKIKLEHYQDGVCYLTSHRIIYVDDANPLEHSIEINLKHVKDIDVYGGFLRSSPKITLQLEEKKKDTTTVSTSVWACPICFFSNKASAIKCELCGVKQSTSTTTTSSVIEDDNNSPDTCRVCTFINHPSMTQCEMCGADLKREEEVANGTAEIKLSFRRGGHSSFLSNLKAALNDKRWDKAEESSLPVSTSRGAGISAIQGRIEKSTLEANETMTDAFQDLDRLMSKATEMVKLAESISAKMSKDPTDQLSELRTHLLNLGISSPVTKNSAGSIYHQELARELAEFLGKLFKQDDMRSLTDIYCLFNRARGVVALISPEDLYKAAQEFERLKLPFRLRKFSSGLTVIESITMDDNRSAHRILKHVKERGGHITALQLAELEKLAIPVASEQLFITERMGLLCRDDGPGGLTFYENLFLTSV
ncbi:Vps36-domain-containing protein [Rhizopus microsporus]|uniref:Vacuolar protein-sorting-associated protein 36 n=1 Tax=Rhizopus microsporus TaxID=58291 RepID=A0A1X0RMX5_RHIZD|nr:Vps36-domain-containing protein [Rhizopus microsporus]